VKRSSGILKARALIVGLGIMELGICGALFPPVAPNPATALHRRQHAFRPAAPRAGHCQHQAAAVQAASRPHLTNPSPNLAWLVPSRCAAAGDLRPLGRDTRGHLVDYDPQHRTGAGATRRATSRSMKTFTASHLQRCRRVPAIYLAVLPLAAKTSPADRPRPAWEAAVAMDFPPWSGSAPRLGRDSVMVPIWVDRGDARALDGSHLVAPSRLLSSTLVAMGRRHAFEAFVDDHLTRRLMSWRDCRHGCGRARRISRWRRSARWFRAPTARSRREFAFEPLGAARRRISAYRFLKCVSAARGRSEPGRSWSAPARSQCDEGARQDNNRRLRVSSKISAGVAAVRCPNLPVGARESTAPFTESAGSGLRGPSISPRRIPGRGQIAPWLELRHLLVTTANATRAVRFFGSRYGICSTKPE